MNLPRVLLADDHGAIADGYQEMLSSECDVIGSVADGQSALEAAQGLKPDVLVMDISMPRLNGLEVCRRLRKTLPEIRVILVTAHGDSAYVTSAIQAGASGYVLKHQAAAELLSAIHTALDGGIYISHSLRRQLWDDNVAGPERLTDLTERQRELVMLVGKGLATKEIAAAMGISFKTAVRRRSAAMRRLDIAQRFDLVRYAIRCRLP